MNDATFIDAAFLSPSAKAKAVVRPLAERLRKDGLKVCFDEWRSRLRSPSPQLGGRRNGGTGRAGWRRRRQKSNPAGATRAGCPALRPE
jgi:hypothetical protein